MSSAAGSIFKGLKNRLASLDEIGDDYSDFAAFHLGLKPDAWGALRRAASTARQRDQVVALTPFD
jgi:hypothetical protein